MPSTESCDTPGIDPIGLRTPRPETAKSGSMKSRGRNSVSRTSARNVSVRRNLRGRSTGKAIGAHRNAQLRVIQGFQRTPSVSACSRVEMRSAWSGLVFPTSVVWEKVACQRVKS